jgi:predicted solute-binding protein
MTGLPFVFAVWVSKQQLSSVFVDDFNKAVGEGVQNLGKVIEGMDTQGLDLDTYYKKNISYLFDEKKQQGMRLFLEKIKLLV